MTEQNKPQATPEQILENDRKEWTRNVGPKYRKLETNNKRYQGKTKKRNRPPHKKQTKIEMLK